MAAPAPPPKSPPQKKWVSVEIPLDYFNRFTEIKNEIQGSMAETLIHLLNVYDTNSLLAPPSDPNIRQSKQLRELLTKVAVYEQSYPKPTNRTVLTSQLKDPKDLSQRRMETKFLLETSMSKINGGEWIYPLVSFFSFHPEKLKEILEQVDEGRFLKSIHEEYFSKVFHADLLDFLELLDSGGSTNVSALREIRKLVV